MPRKPPPVLHDAYDLVLVLYRLVPSFPKAQRFVLGQRIEHAGLDVLFGLQAANDSARRLQSLAAASDGIDKLRLLLRLACDLRFLPVDKHEELVIKMDALGRQIGGWRKWAES